MTFEEVAAGMDLSERTLERDWKRAKALPLPRAERRGRRP
jgi:hypothetical protein